MVVKGSKLSSARSVKNREFQFRTAGKPGFFLFLLMTIAPSAALFADEVQEKAISQGQTTATAAPGKKPAPGNSEYAAFWPSWFQASVTYRGRLENQSGIGFARNSFDTYYLSRLRIEANVRLNKYISFFGMTQDTRESGYNNLGKRPSNMVDTFDLRQAYVDIHHQSKTQSFAFRFGTQYLDMGSKRLVAVSSWSNATPVYHAAKFSYSGPGISAGFFAATRVSIIKAYKINEPKIGENVYGAYFSLDRLVPKAKVEPFLFWRTQPKVADERKNTGDSDLATAGLRFYGKANKRLEYSAEVAVQRGTYAKDNVSAWAGNWSVEYLLSTSAAKPKLTFEYNHATGDKAQGDGTRRTFDQLYASNHSNYGIADQVGWKNTRNYRLGIAAEAGSRIKIQFDVNDFYLATTRDALYSDNGSAAVTNTRATSSHVGWEPDIQATFKANERLTIGAGFARLFCGEFLKQSTPGNSFTYSYVYWEYKY
jgi:hypothetical protein